MDNGTGFLPASLASDTRFAAFDSLLRDFVQVQDTTPALVYLVDLVAADALPALAAQFHVLGAEGWNAATNDAARRELIKAAIELHRYKGTPWAVRRALELLGLRVDVQEWFDIGSAPYTFRVRVAVTGPINWESVARTIDAWKPAGRGYAVQAVITPSDPGELTPGSWPKTKLIHPRAAAGIGIVQVRQPARRVPLVMPRVGAGVGVVRIRQAARAAQIVLPRAGGGVGIIRLGTLPPDSWQTWARPVGDVDAFRRGLLHGWTTRTPRAWRDGNFDSHALVALLRSKFGV